jgi:peptide/nickel transport system substrate-binding protein
VKATAFSINGSLDRRTLLRGGVLGGAGLAAAALLGCGDEGDDEPSAPSGGDTTATPIAGVPTVGGYPIVFPESEKTPKQGGVMKVAASWDVATFDPTKSAAGGTITVPNTVYNRLLGFTRGANRNLDDYYELTPELSSSWERTPDGLVYTFKLRPDVKWHNVAPLNGRPFVAADAKFAYERYAAEGVHRSFWVHLDKIETPDDQTLKVTLKRSLADFINPLASRYQTIFPRETVDAGNVDKAVIGTGPMMLTDAIPGQRVTFERNPDYWDRVPYLDGFEFQPSPDAASRLSSWRAGNIDWAYSIITTVQDVENLLKTNPETKIQIIPARTPTFSIKLNLRHPKFQDERIRQAMMLALDRDRIVQTLFEGYGVTVPGILWSTVLDEEPKAGDPALGKWWRYAPDEAKQLLQAAGAERFEFNMPYYNYNVTTNERQNALIADLYNAVGIKMNFRLADYTEFNSQLIGAKYEDAIDGWPTPASGDSDTYYYTQVHSKSPGNRDTIADPDIDMWAEQQQVELDPEARRAIQRRIWDRVLDKAYRIDKAGAHTFYPYHPWLMGLQWGGAHSEFYDWGAQLANTWLDK